MPFFGVGQGQGARTVGTGRSRCPWGMGEVVLTGVTLDGHCPLFSVMPQPRTTGVCRLFPGAELAR